MFGYVAAICGLTTVLFGLAPALHVSNAKNHDVLKDGARGTLASRRVRWFSGALIVCELALTIVLLAGAGLMIRSFINLSTLDLGISTARLMTMRMQLPDTKYPNAAARRAFFDSLEPRVSAILGIESVVVTTGVPPRDDGERLFEIDRSGRSPDDRPVFVSTVIIGPQFFDVVDRPLVRGRTFEVTDGAPGAEVVIINRQLASQFFAGDDPIGRRLRFTRRVQKPGQPVDAWRTIVGVSQTIWHGSARETEPNPVVYIPYSQEAPSSVSLLVRSTLPPASVMDAVRREVQGVDRDQPVFTIQTVDQMVAEGGEFIRIFGSLFVIFGAIALTLSSLGLYAVVAYAVSQRTREIGVRMALGGGVSTVRWMILRQGLLRLVIGVMIGLAGALAVSRVMERMLVQIEPVDPVTFVAITLLLAIVSTTACLAPATRATRVDPLIALRGE